MLTWPLWYAPLAGDLLTNPTQDGFAEKERRRMQVLALAQAIPQPQPPQAQLTTEQKSM